MIFTNRRVKFARRFLVVGREQCADMQNSKNMGTFHGLAALAMARENDVNSMDLPGRAPGSKGVHAR